MSKGGSVNVGRRTFFLSTAGALVAAGSLEPVAGLALAHDDDDDDGERSFRLLPVPEPIPGVLLPGTADVHIFLPGPTDITLPFSGLQLQGLDVDPTTLTDFRGATALAYVIGQAKGSDGVTYGLEVDIRGFEGEYVAGGARHRGAFALV